jgi:hypothetical protein
MLDDAAVRQCIASGVTVALMGTREDGGLASDSDDADAPTATPAAHITESAGGHEHSGASALLCRVTCRCGRRFARRVARTKPGRVATAAAVHAWTLARLLVSSLNPFAVAQPRQRRDE